MLISVRVSIPITDFVDSPNLYTTAEKPGYHRGLRSNLALFVVIVVLVGLSVLWIKFLNNKHAKAREELGKSAKVVDLSMESAKRLAMHGETVNDVQGTGLGDKAFDDVTDLKNEDFIYLY